MCSLSVGGFEINSGKRVSFAATTISHLWFFGDEKLTDNSVIYPEPKYSRIVSQSMQNQLDAG